MVKKELTRIYLINYVKEGYVRIRVNGEMVDLSDNIELDKNKKDNIDVVIDRVVIKEDSHSRIFEAIETATKLAARKSYCSNIRGKC